MPSVVHHVVQTQPAGGTKNIVPPCAQKLAKCKHDESINHALLYGLPFASVAMRIFGGDIYQRDDQKGVRFRKFPNMFCELSFSAHSYSSSVGLDGATEY